MGQRSVSWLGLVSVLICFPIVARADPITVTGTLIGDRDLARVQLLGERGFRLEGSGASIGGVYVPAQDCLGVPIFCAPGDRLAIDAFWSGKDFEGHAAYRGERYSVGMHTPENATAFVSFTGSMLVPEYAGRDAVSVFAPFDFTGAFTTPLQEGVSSTSIGLIGRGSARIDLNWIVDHGGGWLFRSARYDFDPAAPIPEPATLLLVGSGIAAGVMRRRRRKAVA